jgi:hypothetical protein
VKIKIDQDSWLVSIGLAVAWLITGVLTVIDGLYIRDALLSIASFFQMEQYQVYRQNGGIGLDFATGYMISLLDDVLLLILGLGMVVTVIGIEYYFRKGRPQGLLLKRIGIVFGVEVAIIVVSILIKMVF